MTHADAKQIFATHMQKARERKLTPYETKKLSQARQVLRMHARPAMNAPFKKKKPLTYKGYFINVSKLDGKIWISKGTLDEFGIQDSITVGYANTIADAKKQIDTRRFRMDVIDKTNPKRVRSIRHGKVPKSNPVPVLIYGEVLRIEARKSQAHVCDDECKSVGHRYFHDFQSKPHMYGLPDKSLLITHKRF